MIYLVGGCARSGKSTLAERLRVAHGIPWFPIDALKMGLFLGAPELGVHPEHDDLQTADRMWPIIRALLENLIFDGRPYLVEGVNLRPETLASFIKETETPVRACFLGYPGLGPEQKAEHVARGAGAPNDWLNRMDDAYIADYLAECQRLSQRLSADCARVRLAFFDTGDDYERALGAAERHLLGS